MFTTFNSDDNVGFCFTTKVQIALFPLDGDVGSISSIWEIVLLLSVISKAGQDSGDLFS